MLNLSLAAIATCLGVLLAIQPAINADLAARYGSPYVAALVSLLISTAILLPVVLVRGDLAGVRWDLTPWYALIGGMTGALFITGGILLVPVIGLVLFIACVVMGQAIGSLAMDHFGALNLVERPVTLGRLLGVGLIVTGLVIVLRN